MKIHVDQAKCIGCGTCAALAPDTFKMNDDNKAEVLSETRASETVVKNAADACPVAAIEVKE